MNPTENRRASACDVRETFFGMLGLCRKAGRVIIGVDLICRALRSAKEKPVLVFLSATASDNTCKKMMDKCGHYRVPCLLIRADSERLGRQLGKAGPVAAVAIADSAFAQALEKECVHRQQDPAGSAEGEEMYGGDETRTNRKRL
ncbi:MAG: ribosomal L7Ae/L30e/S12e/Gadd45 family protein [Eubacteriales bacterium]